MWETKSRRIPICLLLFLLSLNLIKTELMQKSMTFDLWSPHDDDNSEILEVTLGYLTGSSRKFGNLEYSRPGLTISGALTLALDQLKRRKFFEKGQERSKVKVKVRLNLIVAETFGDEQESLRQVAALWKDAQVDVILGPQETCLHEAKLASSLNIPVISYFCSDEEASDKTEFETFSRTRPPDAAISRAVVSLVLKYGWTSSLVLIYSDSNDDPRFKRGAKSLSVLFQAKGVGVSETVPYKGPYHHGYGNNPFDPIVKATKDRTRVYIIISQYYEHLGLILALQKEQLLESGEYLVIGVAMDDYKEDEWNPRRYFRGLLHDEPEEDTPRAFRSYLGIIASPPKNYTEFSRQVNRHMEMPPFDWPNPIARLGGIKKIRIEAAYLYDAVFLYANALRDVIEETLEETGRNSSVSKVIAQRLKNGKLISQKLRNVSFKSATGLESEMDGNGDAVGNFTLLTLKNRAGDVGLYPVGYFVSHGELPELALRESIEWIGGSPPVSEPPCGFYGERCQSDKLSIIAVGVILSVLLFVGSASYLVFRHWRLSRDMDRLMWRIDKREIEVTNSGEKSLTRTGSQTSLARFSSVFAPMVTYRGRIFAAKKLDLDLLVLDTPMKQQLKMLREIRHENLNAFIGASELENGLMLVSEYCSRGSIKDILENGDLKLDDMFISSLVGDILRGLSYLHDSSTFRFHGNLKPTNCLVTSQWVLKLSDFGLVSTEAMAKRHADNIGGQLHSTRRSHGRVSFTLHHQHHHCPGQGSTLATKPLLSSTSASPYLAPEIGKLWNKEVKNLVEGFRKADIYSLGIILWELLKRESIGSFLRLKQEAEIHAAISRYTDQGGFWSSALRSLVEEVNFSNCPLDSTVSLASSPVRGTNGSLSMTQSTYACHHQTQSLQPTLKFHRGSGGNIKSNPGIRTTSTYGLSADGRRQAKSVLISAQVIECLESALQSDPDLRPDLKSIRIKLRPLHKGMKSNIFDTMIALMEKYANNLERLVDERTQQLSEEKRKAESLLYELIPASVAQELKEGLRVPAESFEMVSIYFSDIVSFTAISAQSDPIQVVEFLNDLYTCFDAVIENFQVYKVETIGDAYMVASGVPVAQEGNSHALEMARMALCLLETVKNFRIRHRPEETLNLRIGLHSGPVCAGVVGRKRPRYCLFGDTVNTASRMESTGLPRRIHCSEAFAHLVDEAFEVEQRGLVDVKGKGDMTTYWLIAEKQLPERN